MLSPMQISPLPYSWTTPCPRFTRSWSRAFSAADRALGSFPRRGPAHSNLGDGGPIRATNILNQGLHPALESLGLKKAGMHAFRRGCNRRWELAGINPAVIRQQMGHTSSRMTARYTGEVPIEQIRTEFSITFGNKIDVLENMENDAAD
jgi:integrase